MCYFFSMIHSSGLRFYRNSQVQIFIRSRMEIESDLFARRRRTERSKATNSQNQIKQTEKKENFPEIRNLLSACCCDVLCCCVPYAHTTDTHCVGDNVMHSRYRACSNDSKKKSLAVTQIRLQLELRSFAWIQFICFDQRACTGDDETTEFRFTRGAENPFFGVSICCMPPPYTLTWHPNRRMWLGAAIRTYRMWLWQVGKHRRRKEVRR